MTTRERLHEIIYEADTPTGKAFDVALLIAIFISVLVTMLESVDGIREEYGPFLFQLEWFFTILFFVEYVLRLYCVTRPWAYARSPMGIIDLLGWLPTILEALVPGTHYLTTVRILRVLRVFRILKLTHYLDEARFLSNALRTGRRKILVFLSSVLILVVILGSLMYLVENSHGQFTSIPTSIYWAIVTLTTVGYGDITPVTTLGKFISSIVMILGYSIIAVPTGIVTGEIVRATKTAPISTQACPACSAEGHDHDAKYCKSCGAEL